MTLQIFFFFFYFLEKVRFDISCESSALQMIHMKCQTLVSLEIIIIIKKFRMSSAAVMVSIFSFQG